MKKMLVSLVFSFVFAGMAFAAVGSAQEIPAPETLLAEPVRAAEAAEPEKTAEPEVNPADFFTPEQLDIDVEVRDLVQASEVNSGSEKFEYRVGKFVFRPKGLTPEGESVEGVIEVDPNAIVPLALRRTFANTVNHGKVHLEKKDGFGEIVTGDPTTTAYGSQVYVEERDYNGLGGGVTLNVHGSYEPRTLPLGTACLTTNVEVNLKSGHFWVIADIFAMDREELVLENYGAGNNRPALPQNVGFWQLGTFGYHMREVSNGAAEKKPGDGGDPAFHGAFTVKDGKVYALEYDQFGKELARYEVGKDHKLNLYQATKWLVENHPAVFIRQLPKSATFISLADAKIRKVTGVNQPKAKVKKVANGRKTKKARR